MRVSLIGQAAFGEAVFKRLMEDGIEIVGVSAPASEQRPDPLWTAAEEAGLTPIDTKFLKEAEGIGQWQTLKSELGVMAFVTELLPDEILTTPDKGTLQYHPSLLPLHRGSSAMNWPIIFGEKETGLTVFWPDKGMDTGPILLQKTCPIKPDETLGSLYFDQLFPMGIDAMSEAVSLVENGTAQRVEQDHNHSTYEPPCGESHARIQWYNPAPQVYNQIRGCNPQPGAWTTFKGNKMGIFDCEYIETLESGMPGRLLRIEEDGILVRLNGGSIKIKRVQPEGERKISASDWAQQENIKPGGRFR